MNNFPAKHPRERFPFVFDFVAALQALPGGDSITGTPTVTCELAVDSAVPDDAPDNLPQGGPSVIGGSLCVQWVSGGLHGANYDLFCEAQTEGGATIVCHGRLPVRKIAA